jgi:hypothetical protein
MLISGIVGFVLWNLFQFQIKTSATGYNLGLLIENWVKACLGIIIIKFCHGWFCDLEKNVE